MNKQLSLQLHDKLVYSANNFYLHEGIKNLITNINALTDSSIFQLAFIEAPKSAGKTHCSIYLYELLKKTNNCLLISGEELNLFLDQEIPIVSNNIIIIDDSHLYLNNIQAGQSGKLVAFIEKLRVANGKLISFSATSVDELPCDEHIKSRLNVGVGHKILQPSEADFEQLFNALCMQRGLKLKTRQIDFLSKRLGRDIHTLQNYCDKLYNLAKNSDYSVNFELLEEAL
jgi:chromosomal replication initiation ATPase DnaA